MKTYPIDTFIRAGRLAREELFMRGERLTGHRQKPRTQAELAMLLQRALARMKQYPPQWRNGELYLPYFDRLGQSKP